MRPLMPQVENQVLINRLSRLLKGRYNWGLVEFLVKVVLKSNILLRLSVHLMSLGH